MQKPRVGVEMEPVEGRLATLLSQGQGHVGLGAETLTVTPSRWTGMVTDRPWGPPPHVEMPDRVTLHHALQSVGDLLNVGF